MDGQGVKVKLILCLVVAWLAVLAVHADYSKNELAIELIDELVNDLEFDRKTLEIVLADAKFDPAIVKRMERPAESINWHAYREIFLQPERTAAGVQFVNANVEDLERAEKTYQVPRHIVAAIIGVESYYGKFLGEHRVLDALATLGFDYPRRADFFRDQLRHFLILACEERIKPFDQEDACYRSSGYESSGHGKSIGDFLGSYAGAMGYGQFIPESYRNFAVDFDKDGIRDIWTNTSDAIGSIANYFAEHGWKNNEKVLEVVELKGQQPELEEIANSDLKPDRTVAEWRSMGVETASPDSSLAALFAFRLDDGQSSELFDYVLGFDNFYVITRYNRSRLYARVVYQLAMDIRDNL